MKLSQLSLSTIGIVCAVIWLGCGADDDDRVDPLTIGSSLPISPKIAFVSAPERNDGIYVMNTDGTNVSSLPRMQAEFTTISLTGHRMVKRLPLCQTVGVALISTS